MYCTKCGTVLVEPGNFCTRCGTRAATAIVATPTQTLGSKLWTRFTQAVVLQLQLEAMKAVVNPHRAGDNFWSSSTACGNDNGQSGYVSVGGTIVGYDR